MNWRSLLFVPANAPRFVDKAHTRGADGIILDLEDSIAPTEKEAARAALPAAVRSVGQGARMCWCASTARWNCASPTSRPP